MTGRTVGRTVIRTFDENIGTYRRSLYVCKTLIRRFDSDPRLQYPEPLLSSETKDLASFVPSLNGALGSIAPISSNQHKTANVRRNCGRNRTVGRTVSRTVPGAAVRIWKAFSDAFIGFTGVSLRLKGLTGAFSGAFGTRWYTGRALKQKRLGISPEPRITYPCWLTAPGTTRFETPFYNNPAGVAA